LTVERIKVLFAEAEELGIPVILLGGGEPLKRPELLQAAAEMPKIIFPVISVEGDDTQTDSRRGEGVFARSDEKIQHRSVTERRLQGISIYRICACR
jgi:hypothetical protein